MFMWAGFDWFLLHMWAGFALVSKYVGGRDVACLLLVGWHGLTCF